MTNVHLRRRARRSCLPGRSGPFALLRLASPWSARTPGWVVGPASCLALASSSACVPRTRPWRRALSAMAQSIGYLLAAAGPVVFGLLHSLSSGWRAPIVLLIVAADCRDARRVRCRPGMRGWPMNGRRILFPRRKQRACPRLGTPSLGASWGVAGAAEGVVVCHARGPVAVLKFWCCDGSRTSRR